ncbi:MAG: recombination associated protein RdgC [Zhongshania marina]|jgi:recombination associated protein RdgC
MFFKNATIYTFSTLPTITSEALDKLAFSPCGKQEPERFGFVIPRGFEELIGYSPNNHFLLVCLQKEEKILPSSVVALAVDEKVAEIKEREDRTAGRRERLELKEEVTFELLPLAFSKYRRTHAIIDLKNHLLIVDGNSARGDELTSMLREALGSLPVIPISTNSIVTDVMTSWLTDSQPEGFTVGDYCKLEDNVDGAILISRNDDPKGDLIAKHLEANRKVVELSLTYEPLHFVLTSSLTMKSIRFTDIALDEADDSEIDDIYAQSRANLVLMGNGFASVIAALFKSFGGKHQPELNFSSPEVATQGVEPKHTHYPPIDDVIAFVRESGRASVSAVQRKFRIGYNNAARLIEELERLGVVSEMAANGARTVISMETA